MVIRWSLSAYMVRLRVVVIRPIGSLLYPLRQSINRSLQYIEHTLDKHDLNIVDSNLGTNELLLIRELINSRIILIVRTEIRTHDLQIVKRPRIQLS